MKIAVTFVLLAMAVAFDFTEKVEKNGIIFMKIGSSRVSYDSYTILYHFDMENYLKMTEKV